MGNQSNKAELRKMLDAISTELRSVFAGEANYPWLARKNYGLPESLQTTCQ